MNHENPARVSPLPTTPRLRREYRTIESMMRIWCADRHGRAVSREGLCGECSELLAYAGERLARCIYGEEKPTCKRCPVHCFGRVRKAQIREVMRYAGPRMTWRYPWQALLHLLDKLRRVEHPRNWRRRKRQAGDGNPL